MLMWFLIISAKTWSVSAKFCILFTKYSEKGCKTWHELTIFWQKPNDENVRLSVTEKALWATSNCKTVSYITYISLLVPVIFFRFLRKCSDEMRLQSLTTRLPILSSIPNVSSNNLYNSSAVGVKQGVEGGGWGVIC